MQLFAINNDTHTGAVVLVHNFQITEIDIVMREVDPIMAYFECLDDIAIAVIVENENVGLAVIAEKPVVLGNGILDKRQNSPLKLIQWLQKQWN